VEFKTRIDEVEVALTLPDDVQPRGGRGEICRFRCRCNLDDIRITREEIKGGERAAAFQAVRRDAELTKEWNVLQERARRRRIDFLDYEEQIGLWRERRRIGAPLSTSTYVTSIVARCPMCRRTYRIGLRLENPLRAASSMDPMEAFMHLGIDEKKHGAALARAAFNKGFETGRAFLHHLTKLSAERDEMEALYVQLGETVRRAAQDEDRTRFTASQLQLLDENLRAAASEYVKRNERLLLSGLNALSPAGGSAPEMTFPAP